MSSTATILAATISHGRTARLLARLETLLPYTIPLTRRIQCHQRKPKGTSAVILSVSRKLTTTVPEEVDVYGTIDEWLSPDHDSFRDVHTPWLAAFIDLSAPGTTQGWVFGSWEIPSPQSRSHSKPVSASKDLSSLHKDLIQCLFHHIHSTLVPAMPISPPTGWLWLRDNGKWVSQPYSRAKVLFGTLHEGVRRLIDSESVARIDAMYDKWIFGPERLIDRSLNGAGEQKGLPKGYAFGTLVEGELQTILDGSPIPRLLGYLKEVVNAGVYYTGGRNQLDGKGELVAYAFLGKDGSLGSLEVKSPHRGKGLAGQLSRELFRRQAETFSYVSRVNDEAAPGIEDMANDSQRLGREDREGWFSHADVGVENAGSKRVMQKLGGEIMWRVCWVEVDLDVVTRIKEKAREEGDEERFDGEEGVDSGKGR